MTYYDELGLRRDASTQEIRQAYKVLARLVHPDGQADQQVRGMAERQMMRVNEIQAILTDKQRRREYDDSLPELASPVVLGASTATGHRRVATMLRKSAVRLRPQPEPWRTRIPGWANMVVAYWFWIVLAIMMLGVGCWYLAAGTSPQPAAKIRLKPSDVSGSAAVGRSTALAGNEVQEHYEE